MIAKKTDYAVLYEIIKSRRLLEKNLWYYLFHSFLLITLFLVFGYLLFSLKPNFYFAIFLGFMSGFFPVQIGLIIHDIDHKQVFKSSKLSRLTAIFLGNFCMGISVSWWCHEHNQHHSSPHETDIKIVVRKFPYTLPLFFLFLYPYMGINSALYLLKTRGKYYLLELFGIICSLFAFSLIVLWIFRIKNGIIFMIIHYAFAGLYNGILLSYNHTGMTTIARNDPLFNDFLRRQVLTTRNIKSNPVTNFIYGGLGYQIEHHLFPTMPRNNLKKASLIIKPFCQSHGINYSETSLWQALKITFGFGRAS